VDHTIEIINNTRGGIVILIKLKKGNAAIGGQIQWPCFTCYLSGKKIFHPKLRDGFPEKFLSRKNFCLPPPPSPTFLGKILKKYGKIGENMAPW
jgi:hypothetical protein